MGLQDLEQALSLAPGNPWVLYACGLARHRLENHAAARELFERGLQRMEALRLSSTAAISSSSCPSVGLHEALLQSAASACFVSGSYDAALGYFQKLLELIPTRASDVTVLLTMALACHRLHDVRSAVQLYSRTIDLDARVSVPAHSNAGPLLGGRSWPCGRELMTFTPRAGVGLLQCASAFVGRASVLMELEAEQCWALAQKDLSHALHLNPSDLRAILNLALG